MQSSQQVRCKCDGIVQVRTVKEKGARVLKVYAKEWLQWWNMESKSCKERKWGHKGVNRVKILGQWIGDLVVSKNCWGWGIRDWAGKIITAKWSNGVWTVRNSRVLAVPCEFIHFWGSLVPSDGSFQYWPKYWVIFWPLTCLDFRKQKLSRNFPVTLVSISAAPFRIWIRIWGNKPSAALFFKELSAVCSPGLTFFSVSPTPQKIAHIHLRMGIESKTRANSQLDNI